MEEREKNKHRDKHDYYCSMNYRKKDKTHTHREERGSSQRMRMYVDSFFDRREKNREKMKTRIRTWVNGNEKRERKVYSMTTCTFEHHLPVLDTRKMIV